MFLPIEYPSSRNLALPFRAYIKAARDPEH